MSRPCWETEADCKGPCFGDRELAPYMGGSEVAQDARVEWYPVCLSVEIGVGCWGQTPELGGAPDSGASPLLRLMPHFPWCSPPGDHSGAPAGCAAQ